MGSFVSLGAYTWLSSLLLTVVNAALVGVVGWLLIKFLLGFIAKFLKKTKIDPLLHTVILSVTKIALLVLLAISVLDKLGIPTTSIITSLGAVGHATSLAVKDSIATLAGGVVTRAQALQSGRLCGDRWSRRYSPGDHHVQHCPQHPGQQAHFPPQ